MFHACLPMSKFMMHSAFCLRMRRICFFVGVIVVYPTVVFFILFQWLTLSTTKRKEKKEFLHSKKLQFIVVTNRE